MYTVFIFINTRSLPGCDHMVDQSRINHIHFEPDSVRKITGPEIGPATGIESRTSWCQLLKAEQWERPKRSYGQRTVTSVKSRGE